MRSRTKLKSYQITEAPPFRLTASRFENRRAVTTLRQHKDRQPAPYFYIDFSDGSLRTMERIKRRIEVPPLAHETAGKHRIINLEDSSPLMQTIVKYEEGRHRTLTRHQELKNRIKKSLDKAKKKLRTRSYVGLKSEMAQFYGETSSLMERQASEGLTTILPTSSEKEEKERSALKKMGLLHKWE